METEIPLMPGTTMNTMKTDRTEPWTSVTDENLANKSWLTELSLMKRNSSILITLTLQRPSFPILWLNIGAHQMVPGRVPLEWEMAVLEVVATVGNLQTATN